MLESAAVFVPKTVMLELEWVLRGFYGFDSAAFVAVAEHLLGMPQVTIEHWEAVKDAIDLHRRGFDFADALHWATSGHCSQFVSFDDRRFIRRSKKLGLIPEVVLAR